MSRTQWEHPSAGLATASIMPLAAEASLPAPDPAGLPDGWDVAYTGAGRPYYINHILQMTQWEPPRAGVGAPHTPPPLRRGLSPNASPPCPALPDHIESRTTADGRLYYVNHRTQETSWTPPVGAVQDADRGRGGSPLPPHMERKVAHDGRVYVVDHQAQTTRWE